MTLSNHPGRTVCQFCRSEFVSAREKIVHATLDHVGDAVWPFAMCLCGARTFIARPCECGRVRTTDGVLHDPPQPQPEGDPMTPTDRPTAWRST